MPCLLIIYYICDDHRFLCLAVAVAISFTIPPGLSLLPPLKEAIVPPGLVLLVLAQRHVTCSEIHLISAAPYRCTPLCTNVLHVFV